ncbi:hypothetical protein KFK09_025217 [Dendrobium nobile]|uniref:FLZ-type domain-containing protein n=1 Tax=Dendrobium nobile TaxID=94219 RepID=A0A8T3AG01_DENNO|nr:hypothetical protein KFK09_025217 [Dendrobium nobile]
MLAHRPARIVPAPIPKSGKQLLDRDAVFSPLERNPQSPKGWKKREAEGVGLGIVAALEKARPSKIVATSQKSAPIDVTPPRNEEASAAVGEFPVTEFLSCCNLCRKRLDGKDIYIYRGEMAFCSVECRHQQIMSDECTEKCVSGVLRPSEISTSPCSGGGRRRIFFTGIMAA